MRETLVRTSLRAGLASFARRLLFPAAVVMAAGGVLVPAVMARAGNSPDDGSAGAPEREVNPFECYGRWESATGNRTTHQMRLELLKKVDLLAEADSRSVRAMKYCVVAMLKQRLGDDDASAWFERAVDADPDEPGYDLFWGIYWERARGAKFTPVRDFAERHYRNALAKLDRLRALGRFREYHAAVEAWTQKRLLVLHQQDGLALLPWNAYPYHPAGAWVPQLSASIQTLVSEDTRDFYAQSEMRTFTGEEAFAESDVRAARRLTPRERWDLARAPLRYEVDSRIRLGTSTLGAIDLLYNHFRSLNSQVTSFYSPTRSFNDATVEQLGVRYERVFPLYPLFDLRVAGSYRRVRRQGLIEFLPDRKDEFDMYELTPSVSRFFGPDKLTLNVVYAYLNIQSLPGGVPEQAMRQKVIRGGEVVYALYRTVTLPDGLSLHAYRTPTRGWSFYGGVAQDDEIYGVRKVTRVDYYAGTHLAAAGPWELRLQGTSYTSHTVFVDPNDPHPHEYTDPTQTFSSFSPLLAVQARLIDPEASPAAGHPWGGFNLDMVNVVLPVKWEFATQGRDDYENVRGGVELWAKLFQQAVWGAPLLATVGYDAQYFYHMSKTMHLVHASIRLGWGDL
jgi:hypothetical protein